MNSNTQSEQERAPGSGWDPVAMEKHVRAERDHIKTGIAAHYSLHAMLALREQARYMADLWERHCPNMPEPRNNALLDQMLFQQFLDDAAECYFSWPHSNQLQYSI